MIEYLRFLLRNKYYITVEIIGISIAIAFAVPMLSFFSDKWEIDHGRDYKHVFAASPVGTLETTVGLGPQLATAVPEIESYAQVFVSGENTIHFGGDALKASCMAVNPGFFQFFDIGFSAGSPSSLSKREDVLVSTRFAEALGSEPVGQSLTCAGKEYVVNGVFNDWSNSLLPSSDILFGISAPLLDEQWALPDGYWDDIATFVRIQKGAGINDVTEKCKAVCKAFYSSYYAQHPEAASKFKLIRYDRISSNINNYFLTQTWGLSLWAIELFGLILFLFAILNFINLNVALSTNRGKEWGLKKLLGSSEKGIRLSSFLETLFVTSICFLLGYALSRYIVPILNNFFHATHTFIEVDGGLTARKVFYYALFILLLSAITSFIPAGIAARFSPIDIVNGGYRAKIRKDTSNILIGIQCFISVILLSVSILFFAQYKKMADRPQGKADNQAYVISGNYTEEALSRAANALRSLPFVQAVGKANDCPGDGNYSWVTLKAEDGAETPLYVIQCDKEAFEAFGFSTETGTAVSEGLWLTRSADVDHSLLVERFGEGVKGFVSDFVVNAEHLVPAAVMVSDQGDFNRLVISTAGKSESYPTAILQTFKDAFSETDSAYEPPAYAGYVGQFFERAMQPTKAILTMVAVFTILALVLTALGLMAMSTYYVSLHRKETAIRKVYGATGNDELQRNVIRYLRIVMIASILGLAVSVLINSAIIQSYSYRLSFTFWVYLLALLLIMGTAFISVYFQARSVAMNNPAYFIRDE